MNQDQATRLEKALQDAEIAFWEKIADWFPESTSGDLYPDADIAFRESCEKAATLWVELNCHVQYFKNTRSNTRMQRASALWFKLNTLYDISTTKEQKGRILALRARASYLYQMNLSDDSGGTMGRDLFHKEITSAGTIPGRDTELLFVR